jgi:uncharacterized phage protein (TIGR01671 family)
MNREIKFRAWNEVSEKMLNWNDFLDTNMKNTFIAPESTGLILMQYTGLHDKNGKAIYEGDIVEFEDTGEEGYEYKEGFGFNNIAQVVYENGIYTLANFGESDNSYYATDCSDEEILEEVLRNGNCEVIGNIYENSELLGGE